MLPNSKAARRWLLWALAGVLVIDVGLLYFNYRSTGAGPRAMRERAESLRLQHRLLGTDVKRVAAIRDRLPEVQKQCDQFFAEELLTSREGYSTVAADLSKIAEKAGLRATSVNFKQRDLEKRGVAEVDITASVEGDYASLVRFVNGIERSENFYLLESLSMAASSGGALKLNLQMRTYFRS
jgi:Tfp pilus assembly protein PilO